MNSHSSPGARGELERKVEEGERGYKRVSELKVSWRSGDEVTRAGEDGRWGQSRSPEPEPRARLSSRGKCESESGARRGIGGEQPWRQLIYARVRRAVASWAGPPPRSASIMAVGGTGPTVGTGRARAMPRAWDAVQARPGYSGCARAEPKHRASGCMAKYSLVP
jgi:hypothetical protein